MPESTSERFARAVEGELVEADLDEQLRRELAVVGALREIGRSAQLDDVARQRMRRQLLAAAAERCSERAEGSVSVGSVGPAEPVRRPAAEGLRGRLLVAAAAALCLLMSLSAMSLLLARDALPGDPLYHVKRSAESAELGFTFGVESRGFKHLQFATSRVDEIEALAARTSAGVPPAGASHYLMALEAFDTDAAAGSRLLIESASNGHGSVLGALGDWARQQDQRIETATRGMSERVAARTLESLRQLQKIAVRVAALQARPCHPIVSSARDEIGLLPADGQCQLAQVAPPGSQVRPPARVNPPRGTGPGSTDRSTQEPGSTPTEEPAMPPSDPRNPGAATDQPTPTAPVPPRLPGDPSEPVDSLSVPLPIFSPATPLINLEPFLPEVPGLLGLAGRQGG